MTTGRLFHGLALLGVLSLFAPSAKAEIFQPGDSIPGVIGDVFTWNVGDAGSTFSNFEFFDNSVFGSFMAPLPPPYQFTPDAGSFGTPHVLTVNTPGFPVSSGNIYSPFVAHDFQATINSGTAGSHTRIVAQFHTSGSELNYDTMFLSPNLASEGSLAPSFAMETGRVGAVLGGQPTFQVHHLAMWDLVGSQDAYRLDFTASSSSLSLMDFRIDTFTQNTAFATPAAVPEPTTWAFLGVAGAGAFWLRRRRQARRTEAA